ncbi:MAG: hypothetical protein QM726_00345 [Chitinophagaceae bacterium]
MTESLYINASCGIAGNKLIKDGKVLFENKDLPVQEFLPAIYQHFNINYPRFYKMDNLAKLGWMTTEILLQGSFDKTVYAPEDIGLLFCNKNSSLDTDIKYYDTVKSMASPALFVYTLPNIVLGEICIRHQFKGENDFFIFENFDAAFLQRYVSGLLETNALQACICGWVEVLGNDYKACLWLVEKKKNTPHSINFTAENIHNTYQTTHG